MVNANQRRGRGVGLACLGALAALWLGGGIAPLWAQNTPAQPVRPKSVPEVRRDPRVDPRGDPRGVPAAQPPAQPPAKPGPAAVPATPLPQPPTGDAEHPLSPDDDITFTAFTEAVELTALVDYVAKALNVNMYVKGGLTGSVVFNAPVSVKRGRLLQLLDALLEQQGYTVTLDREGFYTVHPTGEMTVNLEGEQPTTRIISTPNVRPTYLKTAIESQVFGSTGQPGGQPGGAASKGIAYVDELGVIVITDTARRVEAVRSLVERMLEEYAKSQYIRLELKFVAAPVARSRALELVGQTTGGGGQTMINPQTGEVQQQPSPGGGASKGIDNLSERLTVDPLGNALIFRGLQEEIAQVQEILAIIDAPTTLQPRNYYAGSAAKQVADIARLRGLGDVTLINAPQQNAGGQPYPVYIGGQFPDQQSQSKGASTKGGPVMVVDEQRGNIIYYGTSEQHEALEALIDQLKIEDEQVVIREYKLRHSDSKKVAELILNLVENTRPAATGGLLPESSFGQSPGRSGSRRQVTQPQPTGAPGSSDELQINPGEDIFVLADEGNNQVLVKAPAKVQADFARLIDKLDQRRPQVYIEAKIVAVSSTEDFRLAFETQLINANGTGGVYSTNFGLSTLPTTGTQPILTPKTVVPGLTGFTAALIKSDQVPIIMTALQKDSDTRILSNPQILVDDNVEASIASVDQQPTTTTSQTTGTPNVTSFNNYVDAGTNLTVKPQISAGGYLRLKYEIKLSSFTGTGSNGIPPPKSESTLKSESVTVPTGSTVVVGGLVLNSKGKTIVKVPLLGDIPIIGALFSDTNKNDRQTTLYVFLTPRILRDPNFEDLRLLTRGPQAVSKLADDAPVLTPTYIEIIEPLLAAEPDPADQPPTDAPESSESPTKPFVRRR